jgi:hypothetical protein
LSASGSLRIGARIIRPKEAPQRSQPPASDTASVNGERRTVQCPMPDRMTGCPRSSNF